MSLFSTNRTKATATTQRRSFLKTIGVGISAALGSRTAVATQDDSSATTLALKLAKLEAAQALGLLHSQFESAMDTGDMEQALSLFTADAQTTFNGAVFQGRELGLRRLFCQQFQASKTGKRMEAAPGFALSAAQQEQQLEIGDDLLTAKAIKPYSIQVGRVLEAETSLVHMARMQGGGVQSWWEGGVYEIAYRKDIANGEWKIVQLNYNTLARADYRTGRSYASAIASA